MQRKNLAVAIALAVLAILAIPSAPAEARNTAPMASAGWHGRPIEDPRPRSRPDITAWPAGWSAGSVDRGSGYASPDGSRRVRAVQRRLRQLGYRPGPVDGRFGPRTESSVRWFQYKHGLARTGRVDRPTLTVLHARSDHRPPPEPPTRITTPETPPPAVERRASADGGVGLGTLLIAALIALAAGLLVGAFAPDLRRREATPPAAPATPVPPPAPTGPVVYGYVTTGTRLHSETAVAAIAALCARRGWSIAQLVHDDAPVGDRLDERPGLVHALGAIRSGAASGLVVARAHDLTGRLGDLVALIESMTEAGAFVTSADRELDTSTGAGRATAYAILDLARWEPRAGARVPPYDRAMAQSLGPRLSALRERGIPLRAIADALNLAGIPNPAGHTHWRPANVQAATREESASSR